MTSARSPEPSRSGGQKGPERASGRPSLGRRLGALSAIAALVGALVAVGFAFIEGDVWRLPVGLIAVSVAVVGSWYLVSRRGPIRFLGALLAAVGLAAFLGVI